MANRRQAATIGLAVVLLVSVSFGEEQNWPFVAFYIGTAVYALWVRAWLGLAAAASVAVVRGMVALEINGFVFQVASVTFAALFLLLVMQTVNSKEAPQ